MLRVGLTGGIACGKSRVLGRFAQAGFDTLDLDSVARDVVAPGGPAYDEVIGAFGSGILGPDGVIDRKALGGIVFADPAARARLNRIVHPRVREEEARWRALHRRDTAGVVVTDAALLVETGTHLRFDRLVVAHCRPEQQIERLVRRDGLDAEAARARVEAQMPLNEKRVFAHFVVDTSGSIEETDARADAVAHRLGEVARSPGPRTRVSTRRALGCLVRGPEEGPRGLTPLRLLEEIVTAEGIEMERVARLLEPAAEGPWYRAGRGVEPGAGPETLAAPLVLWALARGPVDRPFLAAAAASLARLTHSEPPAIGRGCLVAGLLMEAAVDGVPPPQPSQALSAWSALAAAFGGQVTEDETDVRSILGTGVFRGVVEGASPVGAPSGLVEAVERLEKLRDAQRH